MLEVLSSVAANASAQYTDTGHYPWLDGRVSAYIRIAAVSIAAYDYLMTLPAEWRFYRSQRSWRLNTGCILFILIRYISIVVLAVNTAGYFAHFSPGTCARYYRVGPVFKVLQTMVSQTILGIRTVNISRRSPWVTGVVIALFVIITTGEWFTDIFHRSFAQNSFRSCTVGESGMFLSAWLYYLMAMFYDIVTMSISTFYLIRYGPECGRLSHLVRVMLYDGLGYFIALTGANVLNVVLYRTGDVLTQSSGASLGEAITWIMSQKLLIHLRDAAAEANRSTHVVSYPIHSRRTISRVMRFRSDTAGEPKNALGGDPGMLAWSSTSLTDLVDNLSDVDLDVQVEVQRTYNVESRGDDASGYVSSVHSEALVPRVVWVGNRGEAGPETQSQFSADNLQDGSPFV